MKKRVIILLAMNDKLINFLINALVNLAFLFLMLNFHNWHDSGAVTKASNAQCMCFMFLRSF